MSTLVAFEAILAVSCLISLYLAREAFFPASLFWAFGAVAFLFMAVLGTFKAGGFGVAETYYATARLFAGSVGLVSFMLGALSGLVPGFVTRFWWWILLFLVVILSILLLLGMWNITSLGQQVVVGVILLVGLIRLISSGMLAVYLLLGVACLVLTETADSWIALNTGMDTISIFNVLLSFTVVSFGLAASRDNWD
jgi:hypothetical protein